MDGIILFNWLISIIFTICYAYQFFYIFVGLRKKKKLADAQNQHRYAVVICARNEQNVIGNLIKSVHNQDYSKKLIDIFVIADNCSDNTAAIARKSGAYVYERFDKIHCGKGYALDWFFKRLKNAGEDKAYDAYIIFDADNVLDTAFVSEMNKVFDKGYKIITSYRNSKNYGKNWITAGYSLWFLREAKYLNNARMQLGTSCAISGTGFLVSREIIDKNNGWIHHLLTEDIEFTVDSIINNEIIGYSAGSILYDEQPEKLSQSCRQRMRWAKGFYQVVGKYGKSLVKGIFGGSFACYDMLMTIFPALVFTLLTGVVSLAQFIYGCTILSGTTTLNVFLIHCVLPTVSQFTMLYVLMLAVGFITLSTEWSVIRCEGWRKVLHLFTFPVFMITYMPIAIVAFFKKVEWTPITHKVTTTIDDINEDSENKE